MKALALFSFSLVSLFGQGGFEVASVKPSSADARGVTYTFVQGGGVRISNGTLKGIIEMAYDVRQFQISGGPGWMDSDRYDIFAKAGDGNPARLSEALIAETRKKLQVLLAERFQMVARRDAREMPVFELVAGKSGPKLKESDPSAPEGRSGIQAGCGQMTGTKATMAVLAAVLSRNLERPVLDKTDLPGKFDFRIEWTPDAGPCPEAPETAADGPSLFTALQSQLGLKLEPAKAPVEVIVIEHAEKAAGN